jgi:hypothetical protein
MKFGIVLDSNTYIQDFRMTSPRFAALFDYVLKTNSEILLFKLVKDEVLANYRRSFEEKVLLRWEKFRSVLMSEDLSPRPLLAIQLQELQKKLLEPRDGLQATYVSDYNDVDIDVVVSRGVNRTSPANKNGEELRDVILWLATLSYARKKKTKVAFITKDSGFWEEGTDSPATQIIEDISQADDLVILYRTIEAFLAANTLPARAVDAKWASELFVQNNLSDLVVKRILAARFVAASVVSQTLTSYELESGALYDLGSEARFAELVFRMTINIDLKVFVLHLKGSTATSSGITLNENIFLSGLTDYSTFLKSGIEKTWDNFRPSVWSLDQPGNNIVISPKQNMLIGSGSLSSGIPFLPATDTVVQALSIEATGKYLIRLTNDQPTEVKLDNYQVILVSQQSAAK